jgi:hypothetical protein
MVLQLWQLMGSSGTRLELCSRYSRCRVRVRVYLYERGVHWLTSDLVYSALGTAWATSLLGFLSIPMLFIPYVFYKWGPKIRARSRYPVAM